MSQQVTCCLVIRPLLSSNVGDNKNNYDNDNAIFRRKWSIRFSCRSIIVYFNGQNNCHQGWMLYVAVQWGIKRPSNGESFYIEYKLFNSTKSNRQQQKNLKTHNIRELQNVYVILGIQNRRINLSFVRYSSNADE